MLRGMTSPADRDDAVRIDATGTVHPLGRKASAALRPRAGEWVVWPSPAELVVFGRADADPDAPHVRLAGEVRTPGALADIVALIAQSGYHGELVAYAETGARSLFFERGSVVGAVTTVASERLGETLYRFGVITREQLERIVDTATTTKKRVGEVAIELGIVPAEELFRMMARQVEEVFYAVLQLGDGTFYFLDAFDEARLVRRQNLSAQALLMEGARRMDELKYFRDKIPSSSYVPAKVPGRTPPDALREVFELCDGRRSLDDIGRAVGQLEFEVTHAVFQLVSSGCVVVNPPRPEGPEAIVEVFNPALALVHVVCDTGDKGAELREGLARFATGGGVYDPLFMMAGPADDGTLKPERVARNLAALAGDDPDRWLVQLLSEYLGFALFSCESLLTREELGTLAAEVNELVRPVRHLVDTPVASANPSARPAAALQLD